MRKFVVPTMAAALLATATLASAAAQQVTGTITTIDSTSHRMTLSDGMAFNLDQGVAASGWKIGDKVQVSYNTANGVHTATMIRKTQ